MQFISSERRLTQSESVTESRLPVKDYLKVDFESRRFTAFVGSIFET